MRESTPPPTHDEIVELLPWLVNGTLSAGELRRVEHHLASCASCRAARAEEQRLAAALFEVPESEARIAAGLDRLRSALGREQRRGWLHRQPTRRQLLAAVLVQGLVVTGAIALMAWLVHPAAETRFRTLSTPAAVATVIAGPRLRLVVDAEMRISELERLLDASGCRIVGGPTATGVFTLEAQPGSGAAALRALRASAGVRLVEPVAEGP